MSESSQPRYLPSFFVGGEITHKDGTAGTIVRPDTKKVGHFFVQFSDDTTSSQSCSRLYDKNGDLIEDLLQARFFSSKDWISLIDDPKHGLGAEIYEGGDKYIGEFDNGKRIGKGTYTWAGGERYEGQWNGKRHGMGTYFFADGSRYEGGWVDGKREGEGILTWANGSRYEGEFKNDSKNGKGIYIFTDGRRYEGDWVNGKKEGKGIFTWANGDRYEGEFKNDKLNGKGIYAFSDGRRYEGDWEDDKKEGKGIFTWANGDRYEGEFKNDKLNGKGICVFSDGRRYEGDWVNGKWEGKGIFTWANGDRYEGEFKNDKLNGKGICAFSDGRRYEGDLVNGKWEGKGVFTWADGKIYDGEWLDGKQHGFGKEIASKSNPYNAVERYEGEWSNGKKQGLGREFFKDGSRYEGAFDQNYWEGLGTLYDANGKIEEQGLWYASELIEAIQSENLKEKIKFEIITLEQGTVGWLAWRRNGIGASDAPVIMGENPWKSANYLLEEKLGNKKDWTGNEATRLGAANEPKIRQYLIDRLGIKIEPCCIVSTVNTWMQASLDGLSSDQNRVFEIKFGKKVYEHVSRFGEPPKYHIGQLQHILAITGLDFIDYVCGWESEKIVHIEIKRDDAYIQRLMDAEYQFWQKMKKV